jgi:hypothetical protein
MHTAADGETPADDEQQRSEHAIEPRAVKLRGFCVNERVHSVADIKEFLSSVSREDARKIINKGNRNGKTPFHHACQFRSTPDAIQLLIDYDADVNKTTRRGHTALIYACGRGRTQTVQTLLSAGAKIKVRAVTGDDAISMAEGRVDETVIEELRHAYRVSSEPLIDFTQDPDAQGKSDTQRM